jgi:hypothetical protein
MEWWDTPEYEHVDEISAKHVGLAAAGVAAGGALKYAVNKYRKRKLDKAVDTEIQKRAAQSNSEVTKECNEWWNTPDSEYENYLSEGVLGNVGKVAGVVAAYKIGKKAIPAAGKWAIDTYHAAKDTGNQLKQRAGDDQSHTRPDGYRYGDQQAAGAKKDVKESWWENTTEDAYVGYTVDEFGMPTNR